MKPLPYLKKGLILYIKEAPLLILSFIVFPLALAYIYGGMQKDLFEGKTGSVKAAAVDFVYDEASENGVRFKKILSDEKVLQIIDPLSEKPEYSVEIDSDFKGAEIKGDMSSVQAVILKNFTETVLNGFCQYDLVQKTVGGLKLSEAEKQALTNDIMDRLNRNEEPVAEFILEGYKTLDSNEYYTISVFSFTSMLLITTLAGYFYREVREGIVKRTLATPTSKSDYFFCFVLNSFIASALINSAYVIVNRASGIGFKGNLFYIALIVLFSSLLCASTAGFVIAFVKKEMTASLIMNLILVVPSIFGGAFFYGDPVDSPAIKAIINSTPNSLILNAYKSLAVTGNAAESLFIMAALSLALLTVSSVKIRLKWEV